VPMPEVNSSPRKLTAPQGLYETVSKSRGGLLRDTGLGTHLVSCAMRHYKSRSHRRHRSDLWRKPSFMAALRLRGRSDFG
ncbi:hypothetical protein C6Q09_22215, partial [Burkholderia multivorans]